MKTTCISRILHFRTERPWEIRLDTQQPRASLFLFSTVLFKSASAHRSSVNRTRPKLISLLAPFLNIKQRPNEIFQQQQQQKTDFLRFFWTLYFCGYFSKRSGEINEPNLTHSHMTAAMAHCEWVGRRLATLKSRVWRLHSRPFSI